MFCKSTKNIYFTYFVLVRDAVASAGDGDHFGPEGGRDELRGVLGGVRLSLDERSHRRSVAAVQSLSVSSLQWSRSRSGS